MTDDHAQLVGFVSPTKVHPLYLSSSGTPLNCATAMLACMRHHAKEDHNSNATETFAPCCQRSEKNPAFCCTFHRIYSGFGTDRSMLWPLALFFLFLMHRCDKNVPSREVLARLERATMQSVWTVRSLCTFRTLQTTRTRESYRSLRLPFLFNIFSDRYHPCCFKSIVAILQRILPHLESLTLPLAVIIRMRIHS